MAEQPARVLVVAKLTAESPELLEAVKERAARGPARFTLLVPARSTGAAWVVDQDAGTSEADKHMHQAVERLRREGLEVEGLVGDPDPLAAVQDAVNAATYDEVIVSTLPVRLSKWLKMDLPHKAEHATGLPVTHVVAHSADA